MTVIYLDCFSGNCCRNGTETNKGNLPDNGVCSKKVLLNADLALLKCMHFRHLNMILATQLYIIIYICRTKLETETLQLKVCASSHLNTKMVFQINYWWNTQDLVSSICLLFSANGEVKHVAITTTFLRRRDWLGWYSGAVDRSLVQIPAFPRVCSPGVCVGSSSYSSFLPQSEDVPVRV